MSDDYQLTPRYPGLGPNLTLEGPEGGLTEPVTFTQPVTFEQAAHLTFEQDATHTVPGDFTATVSGFTTIQGTQEVDILSDDEVDIVGDNVVRVYGEVVRVGENPYLAVSLNAGRTPGVLASLYAKLYYKSVDGSNVPTDLWVGLFASTDWDTPVTEFQIF